MLKMPYGGGADVLFLFVSLFAGHHHDQSFFRYVQIWHYFSHGTSRLAAAIPGNQNSIKDNRFGTLGFGNK